ncbi:hypothetical protein DFJ63DRAFT_194076 [Scheffersomyces coipomensis]|uniref:uncharacterized protein n=1 Tax=Scheffersomyces coipomensis TaxID=1788519 RepID=UPI00315CABFC
MVEGSDRFIDGSDDTEDSFYNDEYIYNFFTYEFPNFDNYTVLEILQGISIETFLLLQFTTNDEYIKQLQLKDINPNPLEFLCGSTTDEIPELRQSVTNCISYNKPLGHSIPISIDFLYGNEIKLPRFLERSLEVNYSRLFKLQLNIKGDSSKVLKILENFKFADKVEKVDYNSCREEDWENQLNLDISKYINLKHFRAWPEQNLTIILPQSSIQNLTFLSIKDVYNPHLLVQLDNLKTLEMGVENCTEFDIKYLPRNLKELNLMCMNVIININSDTDWPQQLEELHFGDLMFDSFTFENLQHYSLPPKLQLLDVEVYSDLNMFTQLPDSITDMEIILGPCCLGTENILKIPLNLRNLTITDWYSVSYTDTIEFESALEKLILRNVSFPLPHFNFQTLKHSLRDLDISEFQHKISLYHMNFSQFTSLEKISISSSTFESLENFKPAPSIESIYICYIINHR